MPEPLRSGDGSEFIARAVAAFLSRSGTNACLIKPGSPWQNAKIESFKGWLRPECPDAEVFHDLADAQP